MVHADAETAEELVFRLFRRQHLERFLPGLTKLGPDTRPHEGPRIRLVLSEGLLAAHNRGLRLGAGGGNRFRGQSA